ncbi:helix-turn-helix domain-containing protein [Lysobacter sp. GCM10012299]|uniref:helix-turn-helix domain-containing protein n=1 Tax=Lysobacter sp. GCM10012299 TaxID=3317333 RepID=UPI0036093B69
MSELKDRAIEARLAAGVDNAAEWARRIGVKPAAIYQIESGKTRSLKAGTLAQMAKLSGLDPEYIRTGRIGSTPEPSSHPGDLALIDLELFLYADEMVRHEELMQGAAFAGNERLMRLIAMYNLAVENGGKVPRDKLLEITNAAYARNPVAREAPHERTLEASGTKPVR